MKLLLLDNAVVPNNIFTTLWTIETCWEECIVQEQKPQLSDDALRSDLIDAREDVCSATQATPASVGGSGWEMAWCGMKKALKWERCTSSAEGR